MAGMLLCSVSLAAGAGKLYEWTDAAGRLNYSDIPPRDVPAQSRKIRSDSTGATGTGGLRPGELEILEKIARRTRAEHRAAEEARRRSDRRVAKTRKACEDVREKFRNVRRDEDPGPYALFLRRHCW
jgi:hypothetical protein